MGGFEAKKPVMNYNPWSNPNPDRWRQHRSGVIPPSVKGSYELLGKDHSCLQRAQPGKQAGRVTDALSSPAGARWVRDVTFTDIAGRDKRFCRVTLRRGADSSGSPRGWQRGSLRLAGFLTRRSHGP